MSDNFQQTYLLDAVHSDNWKKIVIFDFPKSYKWVYQNLECSTFFFRYFRVEPILQVFPWKLWSFVIKLNSLSRNVWYLNTFLTLKVKVTLQFSTLWGGTYGILHPYTLCGGTYSILPSEPPPSWCGTTDAKAGGLAPPSLPVVPSHIYAEMGR